MDKYNLLRKLKSLEEFNSKQSKLQGSKQLDIGVKCEIQVKSQRLIRKFEKEDPEKKNQEQKIIEQSIIEQGQYDTSFSIDTTNMDEENRRNLIYEIQSFKQTNDQLNQSSVESNNEIFEMVFFNKPKLEESLSTSASFGINKTSEKQQNNMSIFEFKLGKKLGAGKFGEVFIARHIKTGFLCALKRIDKNNIDHKLIIQLVRQIKIQSFLNHPNIVKLYTFFYDERYIYLVMQLCYSGQLYSFLKKKRKLPEALTKTILKDALKALEYMHQREVIHRDLKPENIIYHNGMIKLCDFGWSINSSTMRQTFCGTPLYVSPELLKRKNYNNKIDVWSIGILTYELLFGRVPFDITSQRDFIKIVEDEIKFSRAVQISNEAKQFILICLNKDPRERYTVPQLLEHPFVKNIESVPVSQMF